MTQTRRNIMLGTAGHVDHGKTALVKLLTGCETDSLTEEQRRGLTIDLGFAPCRLADERVVGVVDVPGHVDFIRNMVAGAQGIDVVILVVAADDGIMPQTHEHLDILTLMGVRRGLVALTKIDRVNEERRQQVQQQLGTMLAGTFLANAPICRVCNLTGEGYEGFFDALNDVVAACADRPCQGAFGVWVEDAFSVRGSGTVVTGIPAQGVVRPNDTVFLLPEGRQGHIRRLQVYGEDATEGRAGECVALNIPEFELSNVPRGVFLSAIPLSPLTMAEAEVRVLPRLQRVVPDYTEVQFHVGTASCSVRLALLEERVLTPGQCQMVQLRWESPLCLAPGERFVLRANLPATGQTGLTTIGGGRILQTSGIRLRRKRPWTLERLRARRDALGNPTAWTDVVLREAVAPIPLAELANLCGWSPETLAQVVDDLTRQGRIVRSSKGGLVHETRVATAGQALLETLSRFHEHRPDRRGIAAEELLAGVEEHAEVASLALQCLLADGQVEQCGAVLSLKGFKAREAEDPRGLRGRIEELYRQAGWAPPAIKDVPGRLNASPADTRRALDLLLDEGSLVSLNPDLLMHRDAIVAAQSVVSQLFARQPSFTTMEFRDELKVSRKSAVPLLDHLDRIRWTVRSGNMRTPGSEARRNPV